MHSVLSVRGLKTWFQGIGGTARAVDGVSLEVGEGQMVGVVGESGCGKSALALSVLRLLPAPPVVYAGGEIRFQGQNLLALSEAEMRRLRGNRISMIFQEPMTALNPVFTVGNQLAEVFRVHQGLGRAEARGRAVEMLARVGVPAPDRRVKEHPHQLSGGMRQRVMIAMALACRPALLLADEPTTALDVTIQAQILDLMRELREELGTAILLITHDLGVVAETTERVVVMYAGRVVEESTTVDLFERPLHPYTRGLLAAVPSADADLDGRELLEIPGVVPSLLDLPPGCNFAARCPLADDRCRWEDPTLEATLPDHRAACWKAGHG